MTLRHLSTIAILVLSLVAIGCGDDDSSNNGSNNDNNGSSNNANNGSNNSNNNGTNNASNNANNGSNNASNNGTIADIEVIGTWMSNFDGTEEITNDTWAETPIISYDNQNNFVVFQNVSDAAFDPDKFAKVVWTELADDSFYYCWVAFGLDTEDEALKAEDTSDASDPDNSGCGGFSWTKLTRQ